MYHLYKFIGETASHTSWKDISVITLNLIISFSKQYLNRAQYKEFNLVLYNYIKITESLWPNDLKASAELQNARNLEKMISPII